MRMPPSTIPWGEDMSDMGNSGIASTAPSDAVQQQHLLVLSPKTVANSSPTSPKSFPFFITGKSSNKTAVDPKDIVEDARQAAIHAAYMASQGIIVANYYNHKRGVYYPPSPWREEESVCNTTDTNNNSPSRPSLDTSFSSRDSTTSVTGFSKDAASCGNGSNVSLSHLQSGNIGLDGSVTLTPTTKKKKKLRTKSKKIFVLAQKFGLTPTSGSDATSAADGRSLFSFSSTPNTSKPIKKSIVKKVTQGLWMCNLCGRTFASLQASQDHEAVCIRVACCSQTLLPFHPTSTSCATAADAVSVSTVERDAMVLKDDVRNLMCMSDQSVIKVIRTAKPFILSSAEIYCERALSMLARDCAYYNHMERRDEIRREQSARWKKLVTTGTPSDSPSLLSTVKSRLSEAYELIKEGEAKSERRDHYDSKNRSNTGERDYITHNSGTYFLNVLVKSSSQVVKNELKRLAKIRWAEEEADAGDSSSPDNNIFKKFRQNAQNYIVNLASLALVSDFNARRIAVQTSNDFYRLLVPELKRRGVHIETDIEYRSGAFFVLAINILSIDWIRFIEYTHNDIVTRQRRAAAATKLKSSIDAKSRDEIKQKRRFPSIQFWKRVPTPLDAWGHVIGMLYYIHWIISLPLCYFWYFLFLRRQINWFICQSVVDDLYRYVESKGMEMNLNVQPSSGQASFMLAMLRQMRADERRQKKEKDQVGIEKPLLGDLLGPHIKEDKNPASPPPDFTLPENLEYVCLEIDVPVGFRRLRWALLRSDSAFQRNAIAEVEERCKDIVKGKWSKCDDLIGMPDVADSLFKEFIGATMEEQRLMPANAMVKANTTYTCLEIIEYNNHCFAYRGKTRTPEVPFGSSFYAWTQVVVYNLGKENCHIICSSGAEFPNSRPMVARQIESGIRSGTTESFVRLGETICRYA